jgi:hypothetical protein
VELEKKEDRGRDGSRKRQRSPLDPEDDNGARWHNNPTPATRMEEEDIFWERWIGKPSRDDFFWSTEIGGSHKGAPLFINAEWVSPGDGLKRVYMQQ